ncbi:MAG TPA: cysteine desulfurase family protein [Gemmataceae bacterium]|nr:cysteine desulfurase family protein [Gemmataceae bacterium]
MIYLDWSATTPVRPEIWEAMRPFAADLFGNPASAHAAGRKARQALEDARDRVARLLDARPDEVVFTSGATEANNLALFGLAGEPPGHVLASPVEHPSVAEPLRRLAARGFDVEYLPVDANGILDADAFHGHRRPDTRLAAVMLVNHESGTVQPVRQLDAVVIHCDATQAVGKVPVSFRGLGVRSLSLSAHKFGGPKGVGALLVRHGTKLAAQTFGGHQQQGRRPGTEPVGLAVGLVTALEVATAEMDVEGQRRKRKMFVERLQELCPPVVVNSPEEGSPYILNVSFPGCRAEVLLMKLDLVGVMCSTGSACSSGSLLPSPVLQAMGVPDEVLRSAMRFSFGPTTAAEDLDEAARRISQCVGRLRRDS